ncbi:hypothetical protein ABEF95_013128 [Exophiala dermatitidis]
MAAPPAADQPLVGSKVNPYSLEADLIKFFQQTTATRSDCDAVAKELSGGDLYPVEIQGVCSYTVYAGRQFEYVVQFRLKSLQLRMETARLAKELYGSLAPDVTFKGVIGTEEDGKEPLFVYLMTRVTGITYLHFLLMNGMPWHSPQAVEWRRTLITDVARFFALAWKQPQPTEAAYRDQLRQKYLRELHMLLSALPERFHDIVRHCIDSIDAVFSLPMVLLHQDFRQGNIIVDELTCNLSGVVDWADASICPFGLNLHHLEAITGKLHRKYGWVRFRDYDDLQTAFWYTFREEVGALSQNTMAALSSARVMGFLLSDGFTGRLANQPEPMPIRDDAKGRENIITLESVLFR